MRVLVTGGAGFIGSHLCKRLRSEGYGHLVVDKRDDRHINILNMERLNESFEHYQPDAVVHLAAEPGVRVKDPYLQHTTNCTGTLNVLEACKRYGVKRFVFASSSSVNGDTEEYPTPEDLPSRPLSIYAASKAYGEHLCDVYGHDSDLETVALRFFNVYGPGGRKNTAVPVFFEAQRNDEAIYINGDGSILRDFTYVSDIVDGIMDAMVKDVPDGPVNLGSMRPHRLLGYSKVFKTDGLVNIIARAVDRDAKIEFKPANPLDIKMNCAKIKKAKELWGWEPVINLRRGIKLMMEAMDE